MIQGKQVGIDAEVFYVDEVANGRCVLTRIGEGKPELFGIENERNVVAANGGIAAWGIERL